MKEKEVFEIEGLTFGRYIPLRLLGKGAMGRVYLANDPVLQRPVAIKIIAVEEHIDPQTRDTYLERFSLEARASAKLRHPSIVTVYDAGEQDGFPWIAFEYIEGESLEELLKRDKQIDNFKAKTILIDIASALSYAHETGIVHRDVKPANILIDRKTGISKLSDFGVIKAPFSLATQEGITIGSPGFMSPEQIDGAVVDQRSDLFSLGIIYYQMLTGIHPFLRTTLQTTFFATLTGDYKPIKQVLPGIDDKTEQLISSLLKVKKDDRISSARELLAILESPSFCEVDVKANNIALSENKFEFGRKIIRSFQPLVTFIKKTDSAIFNTAKHPVIQSFLKKSTTLFLKHFQSFSKKVKEFNTLLKWNKKFRTTIGVSSICIAGVILSFMVYSTFFDFSIDEKKVLLELANNGYRGTPLQIMKKCIGLIDKNELNDAQKIAEALAKLKKYSARAYLLDAVIELKDDDEDDVIEAVNNAKRCPGYKKALAFNQGLILTEIKNFLSDHEISREMIDCICYNLYLGNNDVIKKWPYEKSYWLRWNSIKILNEMGQKIDMVEAYILDLKHAGSMRVRIKAVNRLGEMKDKRAISALEDVAHRGFADPIVSVAAQSVLDKNKK